jgi:DNA repair protein RecN (Recombination protein N)
MEEELQVLTHAEDIKTRLYQALNLLSQSDRNILGMLAEARQQLGYVAGYRKELDQMTARLEECRIELKDVNSGIEQLADNTLYDEGRIETINQRLALIYHLEQKHRVDSVEELIHIMQGLSDQLVHHDTLQGRIEVLLAGKAELENELLRRAGVLSGNRSKAILLIEKEIQTLLGALGMPSALFQIRQVPKETPGRSGMDQVTLLFTANRGTELQPVTRVASGGELSRLMLAIKSMVINRNMLPTILFDEIDSGVSGDIAGKVGTIMKKMASNIQVLAISHLPQIAGKAHHHFLAYKEFLKGETVSNLRELTNDERIEEVARIMSNDTVTDTARAAARELIEEIEVNGT